MDGLMFDTERIAFIAWNQAALNHGYEINEDLFKQTIGGTLERTKQIYLAHFGNEFPIEEVAYQRLNIAETLIKTNGVPTKSGLYELLDYLNDLNIKKAIATSTSRDRAFRLLKMALIDSYFDYVLCGNEIENSKPNPEIYLKVAEKLDCLPENCLVLEDSEVGVVAAFRAGMLPIMIPDMKVPNEEVRKLAFRQMSTLLEVKMFLEDMNKIVQEGHRPVPFYLAGNRKDNTKA